MIPKNAAKECRELGKCALREYKGYTTCAITGSCDYAEAEAFRPLGIDERQDDSDAAQAGQEEQYRENI